MIHLIDSFFNNYYVPPLIFKTISGPKPGTNERRRWRTCIDGKQRLTTIRRFFDGEIPYIDKRRQKWYYRDDPNSTSRITRRILPEEEKEFINNVQIVNIEYEYLTDEQEEDMFQRVQLGVPLTVAEKLAALTGHIPSFVHDIRSAYPNIPNLVGTKRATDFRLVTTLVFLMYEHITEEDLKLTVSHVALTKFLTGEDSHRVLTPAFRAQTRRVFAKYNDLIESYPDVFTHKFGPVNSKMKKFSPVEFLGVGVMIDTYPDRPARVLSGDIKAFREYLRDHLQDLRSNSATWVHVMEFIDRLVDFRGDFRPEAENRPTKRSRTDNGIPVSPKKNPAFNPPAPDQQIHAQPSSIYNERQQLIIQQRLADRQQEQREAFQKLPPARPVAIARPSGVRDGNVRPTNGANKRTYMGVKRED
jgi:hypothetical protein